MQEEKIYLRTGGRKHLARKIQCKSCGTELIVSKYRKHCGYCQRCNCRRLSDYTRIGQDELYIVEAGARRRAKEITCSDCRKTLYVRKNSNQKMCSNCNAKTAAKRSHGTRSIKSNVRGYRRIALDNFMEKCTCCGITSENKKIHIHHIDKDRENNHIGNLMPLCAPCHMKIHRRLDKGMDHEEAFIDVRNKFI